MPDATTDALSAARPATSTIPAPDYELIAHGDLPAARQEVASALRNLVEAVNSYISRKGA